MGRARHTRSRCVGTAAGQRYTTGRVSRCRKNSNRSSRLHPRPPPPRSAAPHFQAPRKGWKCFSARPHTSSASFPSRTCGQRLKCRLAATSPFHTTPSTTCRRLRNGSVPDHTYRVLTAPSTPLAHSEQPLTAPPSPVAEVRPGEAAPEASGSQSGSSRALLRKTLRHGTTVPSIHQATGRRPYPTTTPPSGPASFAFACTIVAWFRDAYNFQRIPLHHINMQRWRNKNCGQCWKLFKLYFSYIPIIFFLFPNSSQILPHLPTYPISCLKTKTHKNQNKIKISIKEAKPDHDEKHTKHMVSCFVLANYSCGWWHLEKTDLFPSSCQL